MPPNFDTAAAHRFFAANCFNAVWELLDKPDRTDEDDEQMIALAHASVWHWTQREDRLPRNLSVGYWQLSRVYSILGHGERARHYGNLSLAASRDEEPFYQGYAHESLARAASVLGEDAVLREHLALASQLAESVADVEDQKLLMADLEGMVTKGDAK